MATANYDTMNLGELLRNVLAYREDINAFHAYIDRSKALRRMIISEGRSLGGKLSCSNSASDVW